MAFKEVITRGVLPHWYVPGAAHFVTYRLADTLPVVVLQALRAKKKALLERPLADGETSESRRILTTSYCSLTTTGTWISIARLIG
jgi:hypothetical protein